MKVWVDDIREPPDVTYFWVMTSADAIETCETLSKHNNGSLLRASSWSLDHDLGGDDTTRPIVLWWCEREVWPREVLVHSANPVGVEWLEGMIERYKV